MAAIDKTSKYQELAAQYTFQPIAVESLGSVDSDTHKFLLDLRQRITAAFLLQHISVLFRFNSVLLFDSFELGDWLEL